MPRSSPHQSTQWYLEFLPAAASATHPGPRRRRLRSSRRQHLIDARTGWSIRRSVKKTAAAGHPDSGWTTSERVNDDFALALALAYIGAELY
jgi:hypothetical protein